MCKFQCGARWCAVGRFTPDFPYPSDRKLQANRPRNLHLPVVNPDAAGIDVGSKSYWVAIGQDAEDIREFGVYSEDHQELCRWLSKNSITSIAMESTGTYWQILFSALTAYGFEVILVNGRQTKNVKGKKTDIKDCQWIQKLHCLGLLVSVSALPIHKVSAFSFVR